MNKSFLFGLGLAIIAGVSSWTVAQKDDEAKATQSEIKVKIEDDKVIITNASGETREIDISNLGEGSDVKKQLIIREQETVDGETVTKWNHGVLVDGDGEYKVIELSPPGVSGDNVYFWSTENLQEGDGAGVFQGVIKGRLADDAGSVRDFTFRIEDDAIQHLGGVMDLVAQDSLGKYMLGVSCTDIEAAMRSHLDLPEDSGLLVTAVFDDTPASEILQDYDILVSVNGDELKSNDQLTKIIQDCGENEKVLKLRVVRNGKSMKFDGIKPAVREAFKFDLSVPKIDSELILKLREQIGEDVEEGQDFRVIRPGRGVIVPKRVETRIGGDSEGLAAQIEELRKQVEELRKAIESHDDK